VVIGEPESTSNQSEPDIATLVTVPEPPPGVSRASEPSACTVRTSPSLPPEKFISSALAVIVPDAMSQGCRAESAKAP